MKFSYLSALFLSFFILGLFGCSTSPKVEPGISLELAQFRKANISNITYELYFNIPEEQSGAIKASETLTFTLKNAEHDIQLDFRESEELLKSLTINGTETDIQFNSEHLILDSGYLEEGENTVDISFTAGESSLNRNPEYLYTLFVPDRARTAFPLFDQPDLKAVYDLTLEIPKNWEAISNAPINYEHESDSTKTLNFAPSDLISSYLFSFVVGDFEKVTQTVEGVEMTMLHRESDQEKADRNMDDIFRLHKASLDWLEEYTGIDYPFQKFDFALIPTFQYGGMEHVGAIQYRASSLFLDEDPSDSQLLSRASLIAHETAHMWFGDLVTMEWFNDVWTKEVFANFMAAKIMNPNFPDIDHELNFVLRHHPSAYSVDRTEGANPIRQYLGNLNEAGQMYGAIIYNKAPIMMRQLELLVGEETFREGMREYLTTYSFGNATWPDLIEILDERSDQDLKTWSDVWVNTPGRPHFGLDSSSEETQLVQTDPAVIDRIWPQEFTVLEKTESLFVEHPVLSEDLNTPIDFSDLRFTFFNADGYGYGLFPSSIQNLSLWNELEDVTKGSELINLYENMLEQNQVVPREYLYQLLELVQDEKSQLLVSQILGQMETIYWSFLNDTDRSLVATDLEEVLWEQMIKEDESSRKKTFFNSFRDIALSESEVQKIYHIWRGEIEIDGLNLSETDYISMAGNLAIKMPGNSTEITSTQLEQIDNQDRKRRFEFISPSLSNDQEVRDEFFGSLKEEQNRRTESWVLSALGYLHHPLRVDASEKYILPSLELLQEIQVTGDIFFPKRWLDVTLGNYSSDTAVQTVRDFLDKRPNYNDQLRMKILQAADGMFRVNAILDQR
jgi:aminopeptidase N